MVASPTVVVVTENYLIVPVPVKVIEGRAPELIIGAISVCIWVVPDIGAISC